MSLTIKDIARMAGVSIATVSRVINNKDEGVSPAKRKEIQMIVEAYNYQPSGVARSLVTNKSNTVGFIIPDISNPFFPGMARGVEDVAVAKGYNVFLCNSDGKPSKEIEYLNVLREKRVDGLILTARGAQDSAGFDQMLKTINAPLVFVDEPISSKNIYGVLANDRNGGYIATKHLVELGHKRIACISGPEDATSASERIEGYKTALNEAGIPIDKHLISYGQYTFESGMEAALRLVRSKRKFTAIFAANDLIAYGVYKVLRECGLSIPDDVSVVGFDDLIASQFLYPGLTSVGQDAYGMGAGAAKMLFRLMEKKKIKDKIILFDSKLVIRSSTKKIDDL